MTDADDAAGLKCERLELDGWTAQTEVHLPQSMLILHDVGGRVHTVVMNGHENRFATKPGTLDYYPAGQYERIASGPMPLRATAVHIPLSFELAVLEERHEVALLCPRFQFSDRRLANLIDALARSDAASEPHDTVVLSAGIVDRLYETSSAAASSRPAQFSDTVRRLIAEYIDQNLSTAIQLEKIAFLTGLATALCARVFRNSFGSPLHAYLVSRRIAEAKAQLRSGKLVTDVAHDLGFSSHAHFSTTFRHHTGQTPSEFRNVTGPCP